MAACPACDRAELEAEVARLREVEERYERLWVHIGASASAIARLGPSPSAPLLRLVAEV